MGFRDFFRYLATGKKIIMGTTTLNKRVFKFAAIIAATLFFGASHSASSASKWPIQPIQIVVPYSAGGAVDVLTRIVAKEMSKDLDQPIIVQPRPGGEGNIAAMAVARAEPDGYTLLR